MRDTRISQALALSGPAAMALLIAAFLVNGFWEFLPPPGRALELLGGDSLRVIASSYLISWAAFLLIVWGGSLWGRLRAVEGSPAIFAAIALGGLLVTATALVLGATAITTVAERLGAADGISRETIAVLAYDLVGTLMAGAAAVALAATLGATAVVSFRTGLLPRWLNWATAIIAVGLLTPVNWAVMILGALWIVVVGVLLAARVPHQAPS